ncbi:MAG TPA: enoyl-CoA hydratase/isomerase family protein [Myxococcota bacterium]|jgi:enoyl-CoA hydratase/carnithine racemase
MQGPLILLARDGDVVTLTFNDPARLNAMTEAMGEAFSAAIAELAADASLRAVVLTGAGRAFSAGGDLAMIEGRAAQGAANGPRGRGQIRDGMRAFYQLFLSVRDLPCPVIAAINGAAIGAGLCVALACDVRIAASEAKLGLNFTQLGLHPGMGATWTLPRLVGPARAAEILFSSRVFSGSEAAEIGLVSRAVAAAEVLPAARALAAGFAAAAPLAVRGVKRALRRSAEASLEDQLSFEAQEQAACFESKDVQEGLAAARERRAAKFEGR